MGTFEAGLSEVLYCVMATVYGGERVKCGGLKANITPRPIGSGTIT